MTAVGRVVCDSEGKLNEQSILLETSRMLGNGMRVRLALQDVPSYSIFPGQVRTLTVGLICGTRWTTHAGPRVLDASRAIRSSAWRASILLASSSMRRRSTWYCRPSSCSQKAIILMHQAILFSAFFSQGAPKPMERTPADQVLEFNHGTAHLNGRPMLVVIGASAEPGIN